MLVLLAPGQTDAEIDKVYLGRIESSFTSAGMEQIRDAAETLAPYNFDHIYSSDLYTAQETLRAVLRANHHEPPWEYAEELRERSGGSYEGRKYADIRVGMSPRQYKAWERDPFEAPLHGETLSDVQDRVREWFDTHVRVDTEHNVTILIISHPDTIRALISLARGDDLVDAVSVKIENGMPYFYHGSLK